ncbi:MAG: hypothetical protein QY302_11835 [Anaerolineales bacterium]|nr:MAG: hypothetical protein QY302_11835 [Anaerolineales bacterium]
MKREILPSLFLITAVVLERVMVSSGQIGIGQSLRVLLISLLFIIAISFVLQNFINDWRQVGFVALLAPIMFVAYRALYRVVKIGFPHLATILGVGLIVLLGLFYVLMSRQVWRSIRNPSLVIAYLNLVCLILLIFQIVRIGGEGYAFFKNTRFSDTATSPEPERSITLTKTASPDIYVIILDGYARQDVLDEIYNFDNSEFISSLEDRGFYVAGDSHSNYVQTPYTMASFWNFDYLPIWNSPYEYERYLYQPIQDNRAYHLLDEIGYVTVSMEGAVHYTEIRDSDIYLSKFLPLNDFETLLLIDSPLEPLSNIFDLGLPLQTYKVHRERLYYQLEMLGKVPAEIESPKIVYTHLLLPHPPFVFDERGQPQEIEGTFSLAEGPGFQGGIDEYVKGYRAQVKIISEEVVKVIDAILAESEMPPVIVVMGDHGPASMFNFTVDNPGCIWERTSSLYAILLPGQKERNLLYSSISPVNTFRVIFDAYFGADLPLLEDRSYLRYWQQPTLNVDVTSLKDSRNGCVQP